VGIKEGRTFLNVDKALVSFSFFGLGGFGACCFLFIRRFHPGLNSGPQEKNLFRTRLYIVSALDKVPFMNHVIDRLAGKLDFVAEFLNGKVLLIRTAYHVKSP